MHRPAEGVFERESNVLEYWLANSEGFTVARTSGKPRRVTAVVVDPETRQARSLVVRRSRRRTQVVSAERITAVDPHGRVLYLAPRRQPRPPRRARARTAAVAVRSHTSSGVRRLHPVARAAGRRSAAIAAAAGRVLQRAVATARSELAHLRPIVAAYAHNAGTVARAYARVAEARLRGPWTLGSRPSWTRRARRSPAARSRTAASLRRASKRIPGMNVHWRS